MHKFSAFRCVMRCLKCSFFFSLLLVFIPRATSKVTSLTSSNFDEFNDYELVFVNFFADWCRFSQQLMPTFREASEKFEDRPPKTVLFGTVDSDQQADLATRFHVTKYPTMKLFRYGEMMKKEYRGQRSVDALTGFITKQLEDPLTFFSSEEELKQKMNNEKRNVIAYFQDHHGPTFMNYRKVASLLRDDCSFWVGNGTEMKNLNERLHFRDGKMDSQIEYNGGLANYQYLKDWLTDKCIPLVRELTFENAEELTEEGLPFFILFRAPEHKEVERIFTEQVAKELADQKHSVNCLVADGKKFRHPLLHLGKTESDLPILAIDSFRHMYIFPNIKDISVPGKLRQFVNDLHSGKLHREFHHGPDPVDQATTSDSQLPTVKSTDPPPSVFKDLKPSHTRYNFPHRDEL